MIKINEQFPYTEPTDLWFNTEIITWSGLAGFNFFIIIIFLLRAHPILVGSQKCHSHISEMN